MNPRKCSSGKSQGSSPAEHPDDLLDPCDLCSGSMHAVRISIFLKFSTLGLVFDLAKHVVAGFKGCFYWLPFGVVRREVIVVRVGLHQTGEGLHSYRFSWGDAVAFGFQQDEAVALAHRGEDARALPLETEYAEFPCGVLLQPSP